MRHVATAMVMMLGLLPAALAGCVIPPSLHEVGDAGGNQRPLIRRSLTLPTIGSYTVEQSPKGKPSEKTEFNVAMQDADRDALYLRMFIDGDYKKLVPISQDQTQGGSVDQSQVFSITGLCDEVVDWALDKYSLELYVSDREFVSTGNDLRLSSAGGLGDSVMWIIYCVEDVPSKTGG